MAICQSPHVRKRTTAVGHLALAEAKGYLSVTLQSWAGQTWAEQTRAVSCGTVKQALFNE